MKVKCFHSSADSRRTYWRQENNWRKRTYLTMIRSSSCDSHFLFPVSVAKETDVWQENLGSCTALITDTLCEGPHCLKPEFESIKSPVMRWGPAIAYEITRSPRQGYTSTHTLLMFLKFLISKYDVKYNTNNTWYTMQMSNRVPDVASTVSLQSFLQIILGSVFSASQPLHWKPPPSNRCQAWTGRSYILINQKNKLHSKMLIQ